MSLKRKGRKRRRGHRSLGLTNEPKLLDAASQRAYYDALHEFCLELAEERLKDPEYRALVEDFMVKTYEYLARRKETGGAGFALWRTRKRGSRQEAAR